MTTTPVYDEKGHCPICDRATRFASMSRDFRDQLVCADCPRQSSVPRERALMLALERHAPDWRNLRIHESSPAERGVSAVLKDQCRGYVPTQFLPGVARGSMVDGVRCEDLEAQTFADESFDIVLTQDVLEHLFAPDAAMRETARTLAPGGIAILTTPTVSVFAESYPVAIREADGSVRHYIEPEYHGNPVDPNGSLVTWHFGYDLADRIGAWSGLDVVVERSVDRTHGVLGPMTEVYVCRKPGVRKGRRLWGFQNRR